MNIPESIREHLPGEHYATDNIGCSQAQVLMFEDRVLKIQPECTMAANEVNMTQWLRGKLHVPEIIAEGACDGTRFMLMTRIPGKYLCDAELLDDQHRLAELMAEGLHRLWAVDVTQCPTDRTLHAKFREIEAGLRGGWITADQASQPETYGPGGFESPAALYDWLVKHQPEEEHVLSHGDYCLPNIFADERGLTGYIDLGYAGVADKWVDIEQGLWSMWANTAGIYSKIKRKFDRTLFFDALGMKPDDEILRYYSLLSELC